MEEGRVFLFTASRSPPFKVALMPKWHSWVANCDISHLQLCREFPDWGFGVRRYKLLHLGWIRNEVLLYSIGNYIQSLMRERDGR